MNGVNVATFKPRNTSPQTPANCRRDDGELCQLHPADKTAIN